jgi:cytochrome c553
MKRESRNGRTGLKLCFLGMIFSAGIALSASHYTDLRRIEPIHGDPAAGATQAVVCFACHGANGNSIAPNFPRLAGQRPDYLYYRMRSFKSASASDPYYSKSPMTALAAPLTDGAMRDLAAFFSSQPPTAGAAAPAGPEVEEGSQLFHAGDAARGIPPCQGCHGADANGSSARTGQYRAYPSLRGQYAAYVIGRLSSFRDGRPHDTTNDMIMGGIAHTLDDASIQAIAAWLNSLAPAQAP